MGESKFPKNWKEVRERIKNKEITATAGYRQMGISKTEYYKLVKLEKETEGNPLDGKEVLTPSEYFQELKDSVKIVDDEELTAAFASAMKLMEGYKKSGQEKSIKKLEYLMRTLMEEKKLVDMGIDTFVYRSDVGRFISKVEKKVVKVIELRNYERPIPDEITEVVNMTKDIFSDMFVVFTDYTGKAEKEVQKERRDKDPILFGVFKDSRNHPLSDRMYFLGDWIDDKCDLTLDSLVEEMSSMTGETISHHIQTLKTTEDFEKAMASLKSKEEDIEDQKKSPEEDSPRLSKKSSREFRVINDGEPVVKKLFKKVRSILKK